MNPLYNNYFHSRIRGESRRKWIDRNLQHSHLSYINDYVQISISLVLVILFLVQNWYKVDSYNSDWVFSIEKLGAFIFLVDYVLRAYVAEDRFILLTSPQSLVDLITLVPGAAALFLGVWPKLMPYQRILRMLRSLMFLRIYRLLSYSHSAAQRQISLMIFTVSSVIICTGGIVQSLEYCFEPLPSAQFAADDKNSTATICQDLPFYDAAYFIVITITTLGYGDIVPKTVGGQASIMVMITITAVLIPAQIRKLNDILSRHSEYDLKYNNHNTRPHLLICGEVESGALQSFLHQLFHPLNVHWKGNVVVLCPSPPSNDLRRVLLHKLFEGRVHYLLGSAMLDADLIRAQAGSARASFVMVNKCNVDPDQSDTAGNLLTISLRHFVPAVPLFAEVYKSDNKHHIQLSGASNVICAEQIKLGFLARSCQVPGLSTMMNNLMCQFDFPTNLRRKWFKEYSRGVANRVYVVNFPSFFYEVPFMMIVDVLFQAYGAVAFGIRSSSTDNIIIFPPAATVDSHSIGYVIASDQSTVDNIETMEKSLFNFYMDKSPVEVSAKSTHSRDSSFVVRRTQCDFASLVWSILVITRFLKRWKCDRIAGSSSDEDDTESEMSDVNDGSAMSNVLNAYFTNMVNNQSVYTDRRRSSCRASFSDYSNRFNLREPESVVDYELYISERCIPPYLCNHIVLCGIPHSLVDFIEPLRRSVWLREAPRPIVIICPFLIAERQYNSIALFKDVYFVQGSPLDIDAMESAHIFEASHVVVLSNPTKKREDVAESKFKDPNMIDADALAVHRFILEAFEIRQLEDIPKMQIELSREGNMKFLAGTISGLRQDSTTLNWKKNLFKKFTQQSDTRIDNPHAEDYAAGEIYLTYMLDAWMSANYDTPELIDLIQLLVVGHSPRSNASSSRYIELINVPPNMIGWSYCIVFQAILTDLGAICFGIERSRGIHKPFIFTNPPHTTVVSESDRLFILR